MPYPWQSDVAAVAGELNDARDGWHYPVVVLSVPRRAGKTMLTLATNLAAMDVIGDARCWYTAQRRETAAKLFRDEWTPLLEPLSRLYRLRKSQGSEGVHKRRGSSSLQLFAPTADALHSVNADTATVDEAWWFDIDAGESLEAGITPAQLTRPWRQLWIVSAGGTVESTWWDRWLTAAAAGLPGVALFDYGADAAAPDYDPSSPDVWARAHPTAGRAFPLSVLEQLWVRRRDDASFERSYLNVWPRPSEVLAAGGLDADQWRASSHPAVVAERVTAIAFDIAADRSAAAIATAGPIGDRVVVEIVDARPGVGWVAAAVKATRVRHRGAVVVADSLVTAGATADLERAGVSVIPIGARNHAQACGAFVDRLAAGQISQRAQAVLDDAVTGAARRPLGDAWLWSRARSQADISPLVAATLAVWAASTRPNSGRGEVVVPPAPRNRGGRGDYTRRGGFGRPGRT